MAIIHNRLKKYTAKLLKKTAVIDKLNFSVRKEQKRQWKKLVCLTLGGAIDRSNWEFLSFWRVEKERPQMSWRSERGSPPKTRSWSGDPCCLPSPSQRSCWWLMLGTPALWEAASFREQEDRTTWQPVSHHWPWRCDERLAVMLPSWYPSSWWLWSYFHKTWVLLYPFTLGPVTGHALCNVIFIDVMKAESGNVLI